ncbi:hypothetical protein NDU88_005498 [Pleurodeles waltl]|uniref:Uncharacterized protein n=1 Tax=Pleurodeles waltl TaxID=8319 RepID=A0AAV7MXR1_PLEWA|nr:hypothetical protein NDU88_005498 [Pleurodeles waltl]
MWPPLRTPMSGATEALQSPGGRRRPAPRGAASGSPPRPREAGPTSRATLQLPLLQRGEAADIRRSPTLSSLGQLRPGRRILQIGPPPEQSLTECRPSCR